MCKEKLILSDIRWYLFELEISEGRREEEEKEKKKRKTFFSFHVKQLKMASYAEGNSKELLTISDHIVHLRQWLQRQQPILNSLDTDEFLLRFLRVTDFRLENAKERLINFWKYRTENHQW
jgi:DNA repair ATPase RecN